MKETEQTQKIAIDFFEFLFSYFSSIRYNKMWRIEFLSISTIILELTAKDKKLPKNWSSVMTVYKFYFKFPLLNLLKSLSSVYFEHVDCRITVDTIKNNWIECNHKILVTYCVCFRVQHMRFDVVFINDDISCTVYSSINGIIMVIHCLWTIGGLFAKLLCYVTKHYGTISSLSSHCREMKGEKSN